MSAWSMLWCNVVGCKSFVDDMPFWFEIRKGVADDGV